ncbi:hypothetical protein PUN28_010545 [Cardiocondyla obscurior]|uniref:Uncharacterized protein n=1 Tax=Cardiocondyla obscurior TaxID=286306 RepID=A0AAW2FJ00_9HYME
MRSRAECKRGRLQVDGAFDCRWLKQLTSQAFSIDNHSREPWSMKCYSVPPPPPPRASAIPDAIINRESPMCINIIRSAAVPKPFRKPFRAERPFSHAFWPPTQTRTESNTIPPLLCNNVINSECGEMTRPKNAAPKTAAKAPSDYLGSLPIQSRSTPPLRSDQRYRFVSSLG